MEKGSGSFGGKKGPFPWSSFPLSAPNGAYCVKWRKAGNYPIGLDFFQETQTLLNLHAKGINAGDGAACLAGAAFQRKKIIAIVQEVRGHADTQRV
jgi:hypothetical protein